MADKNDFTEIIAKLLIKSDRTNDLLAKVVGEVVEIKENTEQTQQSISDLKSDISDIKTNISDMKQLQIQSNQTIETIAKAVAKLADIHTQSYIDHEERLKKIESVLFSNK